MSDPNTQRCWTCGHVEHAVKESDGYLSIRRFCPRCQVEMNKLRVPVTVEQWARGEMGKIQREDQERDMRWKNYETTGHARELLYMDGADEDGLQAARNATMILDPDQFDRMRHYLSDHSATAVEGWKLDHMSNGHIQVTTSFGLPIIVLCEGRPIEANLNIGPAWRGKMSG